MSPITPCHPIPLSFLLYQHVWRSVLSWFAPSIVYISYSNTCCIDSYCYHRMLSMWIQTRFSCNALHKVSTAFVRFAIGRQLVFETTLAKILFCVSRFCTCINGIFVNTIWTWMAMQHDIMIPTCGVTCGVIDHNLGA